MNSPSSVIDKERLAVLQDGMYSIAMTLLVLELRLPQLGEQLSNAMLWSALMSIRPKLLVWLLSFWVLAIFWINDVRTLATIVRVDRMLLRLSLARLALVSLLPFSTALVGEHGGKIPAAAVYAAHLFLMATVQCLRYLYLHRHRTIAAWPDEATSIETGRRHFSTLICTAVAVGLAFVVPGYNMFALIPILFVNSLFRRIGAARKRGS